MPAFRQASLLSLCLLAGLGACRLVDQTSFDPALRARLYPPPTPPKPVPVIPTPGPAPLVTIRNAEQVDYRGVLAMAVAQALSRKSDVVFNVVTVVPDTGSVADRIAAVRRVAGDARQVASDIQNDGVDPGQVELGARAEPGITGHEVRVYVQ